MECVPGVLWLWNLGGRFCSKQININKCSFPAPLLVFNRAQHQAGGKSLKCARQKKNLTQFNLPVRFWPRELGKFPLRDSRSSRKPRNWAAEGRRGRRARVQVRKGLGEKWTLRAFLAPLTLPNWKKGWAGRTPLLRMIHIWGHETVKAMHLLQDTAHTNF